MAELQNLEQMLASGQDNALLRFALGSAFIRHGRHEQAAQHLARAVELDPGYSAAWKLLGRALADSGALEQAREAYEKGIAVARRKGDVQAEKEMTVFLKRLQRSGS